MIGATLATSAVMATGFHGQSGFYCATLQAAAAMAAVILLFVVAHAPTPLRAFGIISYAMMVLCGVETGIASDPSVYAAGFVAAIGFDKMFSVYIRRTRQKIIPPRDFGKTTGLIVMLNNLPQPLAGLLVGLFSGSSGAGAVILGLSSVMGAIGIGVAISSYRAAQRNAAQRNIVAD